MIIEWYGGDSPHLASCEVYRMVYRTSEQARSVKTVKVPVPMAVGLGSDRRLPPGA